MEYTQDDEQDHQEVFLQIMEILSNKYEKPHERLFAISSCFVTFCLDNNFDIKELFDGLSLYQEKLRKLFYGG